MMNNTYIKEFTRVVLKMRKKLSELNRVTKVFLHWIKGHSSIHGNEVADRAANLAHDNNRSEIFDLSQSEYVSQVKIKLHEFWKRDWHQTVNQRGVGLHLKELDDRLRYNRAILHYNDRWSQVVMNRMRIGHIGLNEYLHRFHMVETESCECEQISCLTFDIPETLEHFLLSNVHDLAKISDTWVRGAPPGAHLGAPPGDLRDLGRPWGRPRGI